MSLKPKSAFTLIELLVVVFIIGILSTVMLANFRAAEKQKRVQLGSDTAISAVRTLQNIVQSGKQIEACNPTPVYYYIQIPYNATSLSLYCFVSSSQKPLIQTFNLPSGVRVKDQGISINGTVQTQGIHIDFFAPFATVGACPIVPICTGPPFQTVTIILESTDSQFSRTVTVDGISGKVQ